MTSAYEEARLARIKENAAALEELGIHSLVSDGKHKHKHKHHKHHKHHHHSHHDEHRKKKHGSEDQSDVSDIKLALRPRESLIPASHANPEHPNMPRSKRARRSSTSSSSRPRKSRALRPRSVNLREFAVTDDDESGSSDSDSSVSSADSDDDGFDGSTVDACEGRRKKPIEEWYDEDQVKSLGSCKRRYAYVSMPKVADTLHGTICHQCLQQTRDIKTRCSFCDDSQGILCGPCLQIRYGENILEVVHSGKTDPSWKCPACRGICNCDACRKKMGLKPIPNIVVPSGYASVAHWIVLTHSSSSSGNAID